LGGAACLRLGHHQTAKTAQIFQATGLRGGGELV
jgi:hypothetical protein